MCPRVVRCFCPMSSSVHAQIQVQKGVHDVQEATKFWGGRPFIERFSYEFSKGERLGVVGPNGAGKSTLLDMLAGLQPPDEGARVLGDTSVVGYFAQHPPPVNPKLKLIDYICSISDSTCVPRSAASLCDVLSYLFYLSFRGAGRAIDSGSGCQRAQHGAAHIKYSHHQRALQVVVEVSRDQIVMCVHRCAGQTWTWRGWTCSRAPCSTCWALGTSGSSSWSPRSPAASCGACIWRACSRSGPTFSFLTSPPTIWTLPPSRRAPPAAQLCIRSVCSRSICVQRWLAACVGFSVVTLAASVCYCDFCAFVQRRFAATLCKCGCMYGRARPVHIGTTRCVQVLESLLEAYSGCVLIVSHDKAFMENVVDAMLILDGSGAVQLYNGRYSDYLKLIDRRLRAAAAAAEEEEAARRREAAEERAAAAAVSGNGSNGSSAGHDRQAVRAPVM